MGQLVVGERPLLRPHSWTEPRLCQVVLGKAFTPRASPSWLWGLLQAVSPAIPQVARWQLLPVLHMSWYFLPRQDRAGLPQLLG